MRKSGAPLVLAAVVLAVFVLQGCGGRTDRRDDGSRPLTLSLSGRYFIVPSSHPDFARGVDDQRVTGLVEATLGPGGFPVVSSMGRSHTGPSGAITDVTAQGEIRWWSTAGPHGITLEKTQSDSLPLRTGEDFFPGGQTSNTNSMRTVHWMGSFTLQQRTVLLVNLGADDDAWLFINGQLRVDNGGVKHIQFAPEARLELDPGTYELALFFADRHPTRSRIELEIRTLPAP